jgi:hypothetical protein
VKPEQFPVSVSVSPRGRGTGNSSLAEIPQQNPADEPGDLFITGGSHPIDMSSMRADSELPASDSADNDNAEMHEDAIISAS